MKHQKKYLFDDPKNIKWLLRLLYLLCTLLFIMDFVVNRHINHDWENLWGFYPIFGFVGCVVLVLVATWLRTFLMRDEYYYGNEATDDKTITHSATNSDDASKRKGNIRQKIRPNLGDHNVDN